MFSFIPPFFRSVEDQWLTTMVSIEPGGYKIERRGEGAQATYRVSGPNLPTTVVGSLSEARSLVERKLREVEERRRQIDARRGDVDADDEIDTRKHSHTVGFGFHEGRLFAVLFDARRKPTLVGHLDQLEDMVEQFGLEFQALLAYAPEIEEMAESRGGLLYDGSGPHQWGIFDIDGRPGRERFKWPQEAVAHQRLIGNRSDQPEPPVPSRPSRKL